MNAAFFRAIHTTKQRNAMRRDGFCLPFSGEFSRLSEQIKNTRHIIQNMSDLFQNISDIFQPALQKAFATGKIVP